MSSQSSSSSATYFRLFYYNVHDLTSSEQDVTVRQSEAHISGLCPFCKYSVRVVAFSVSGVSVSADVVSARTLSDGLSLTSVVLLIASLLHCF